MRSLRLPWALDWQRPDLPTWMSRICRTFGMAVCGVHAPLRHCEVHGVDPEACSLRLVCFRVLISIQSHAIMTMLDVSSGWETVWVPLDHNVSTPCSKILSSPQKPSIKVPDTTVHLHSRKYKTTCKDIISASLCRKGFPKTIYTGFYQDSSDGRCGYLSNQPVLKVCSSTTSVETL